MALLILVEIEHLIEFAKNTKPQSNSLCFIFSTWRSEKPLPSVTLFQQQKIWGVYWIFIRLVIPTS
jgi:hypothetical protein